MIFAFIQSPWSIIACCAILRKHYPNWFPIKTHIAPHQSVQQILSSHTWPVYQSNKPNQIWTDIFSHPAVDDFMTLQHCLIPKEVKKPLTEKGNELLSDETCLKFYPSNDRLIVAQLEINLIIIIKIQIQLFTFPVQVLTAAGALYLCPLPVTDVEIWMWSVGISSVGYKFPFQWSAAIELKLRISNMPQRWTRRQICTVIPTYQLFSLHWRVILVQLRHRNISLLRLTETQWYWYRKVIAHACSFI